MLMLAAAGCTTRDAEPRKAEPTVVPTAVAFDGDDYDRLLTESIDRTGKRVAVEWGFGHEAQPLSAAERRDVIAYVRALARARER
jgi:hypothetical protein